MVDTSQPSHRTCTWLVFVLLLVVCLCFRFGLRSEVTHARGSRCGAYTAVSLCPDMDFFFGGLPPGCAVCHMSDAQKMLLTSHKDDHLGPAAYTCCAASQRFASREDVGYRLTPARGRTNLGVSYVSISPARACSPMVHAWPGNIGESVTASKGTTREEFF